MTLPEVPGDITRLLTGWRNGDADALEKLTPIVYSELRLLAQSYLRQERAGHTLEPTGLLHEAYLRLLGQSTPEWQNRSHFFGVAARIMRQVLVDGFHKRFRNKLVSLRWTRYSLISGPGGRWFESTRPDHLFWA